MILFVSGRCDIPAFYSEWFFHRLEAGFVDVRNPYNEHQISQYSSWSDDCGGLHPVLHERSPIPMLPRLKEIPFPVSVPCYPDRISFGISNRAYRDKQGDRCSRCRQLSEMIGRERRHPSL